MMDGNMGFNPLFLGHKSDLQLMGRRAAEPWNGMPARPVAEARKKAGFLARFNRLFEHQAASEGRCCET